MVTFGLCLNWNLAKNYDSIYIKLCNFASVKADYLQNRKPMTPPLKLTTTEHLYKTLRIKKQFWDKLYHQRWEYGYAKRPSDA